MQLSPLYHNTRPEGELLPQEAAAFDLLDRLAIPYDRVSGDSADTMEKCDEVSQVLGVPICKNLFLCNRQKTEFYLLLMPPHKPFKTKDLSRQIGSARLSFAAEEDLWEMLRVTPGSATVLGLMNDRGHRVRLLIDRPVAEAEFLSCHPCICTSSLKLRTADVFHVLLPHTGHEPTIVDLPDAAE
jgi:Ala-tRNA(Pro) deacylase